MIKHRERVLEAFLYVTFPIALFAGCSGLANTKNEETLLNDYPEFMINEKAQSAAVYGDDASVTDFSGIFENPRAEDLSLYTTRERANTGFPVAADSENVSNNNRSLQSIIRFQSDDYRVKSFDRALLSKHAKLLSDNPGLLLSIIGYADSRGSAAYNQRLSEKRAAEIYRILVAYGAPKQQLMVDAIGETGSVYDGADSADNRRVELVYTNSLTAVIQH